MGSCITTWEFALFKTTKGSKATFIEGTTLKRCSSFFGQTEAKQVSTPADLNIKLQKEDGVSRPVDAITYQPIVGSLLCTAITTGLDIAQAVGVVSRFCANPTQSLLIAAKLAKLC